MQFRTTIESLIICIEEFLHSPTENQAVCPLELETATRGNVAHTYAASTFSVEIQGVSQVQLKGPPQFFVAHNVCH